MNHASVRLPALRLDAKKARLIIRIDTREQLALDCWPNGVCTERATVEIGDYTTPWLAGLAAVERKSASDFIGSLTHDRERFDRVLGRAEKLEAFAIVVEASFDEVSVASATDWRSLIGSIASFGARGFGTYFVGSRLASARLIAGLLSRWERRFLPRVTPLEQLRAAALRVGLRHDFENRPRFVTDPNWADRKYFCHPSHPGEIERVDPDPNDPRRDPDSFRLRERLELLARAEAAELRLKPRAASLKT
jgi:DNA excision repair protein ERCC-4